MIKFELAEEMQVDQGKVKRPTPTKLKYPRNDLYPFADDDFSYVQQVILWNQIFCKFQLYKLKFKKKG